MYEVANGEAIPNKGERRLVVMTQGSQVPKMVDFQVCDVHKALMSLSKAADAGFETFLGKHGGWMRDVQSGDQIPLERRGNLYFLKYCIKGITEIAVVSQAGEKPHCINPLPLVDTRK